jgi:hypothetical protein
MDDAELLSFGFKYGFKLHYEGSKRLIETKNLKSVMQNPLTAKEKIENEIFKIEHFEDLHQQVV